MKPNARLTRPLQATKFSLGSEEYVVFELDAVVPDYPVCLTRSEREVVGLTLAGLDKKEVARRRSTAVSTVRNQLQSVFEKLGVANRYELALACLPVARRLPDKSTIVSSPKRTNSPNR